MRGLSTNREVLLALLVGAIPLLVVVAILAWQLIENVPAARRERDDTIHDFQTIRAIAAIDEAIQDAERGQRGFLITNRNDYLVPYDKAVQRLPTLMTDLQSALAGDVEQQQRLLHLQSDITTKLNELESTISTMRHTGYDAAKEIVETDVGRRSMQAISADLAAIGEAANNRLSARLASAAAADSRLVSTFIAGSVIAALGLLAGMLVLVRATRRATVSERTLQATLDSVREGVVAIDQGNRLRAWNAPFAAVMGASAADFRAGQRFTLDAIKDNAIASQLQNLAATARTTGRPAMTELPAAQGRNVEVFYNPTGGGYVVTLLDVTERRQVENALAQSQKLESLGRMTGGVAHDFNNLLTIIIGGLGLLGNAVRRNSDALRRIDMMMTAAERASRLIKQLLAFARRQPLRPEIVNLAAVIQEGLPLIRRAVGEAVTVECVVGAGLWNTTVDPAEFQAAVLNLAINSRDAMPGGGELTIELANAALDDAYAAAHAEVEPGQYVMFAITDTGAGMDTATMTQALDPFFTTKGPGEGTGLGLPQVYGFVKQLGGHLKIYSERGVGTTVKLYLPRSLAQEAASLRQVSRVIVAGTETILLVDDDDTVRATVALMLEELGYTVVEARGAEEALAILREGCKPDLLFTDVVMPKMSGRSLADAARKIAPDLRVLYTSGYTENAIVHHGQLDPGVELLSKPFSREQLGIRLRRLLDGAPDDSRSIAGSRDN
jgi:signal transduction histidine kinase/CheY-like chemotaxis protein